MEKMFRNEEWKPFFLKDCDHSIEEIHVSNFGRVKRKKPNQKEYRLSQFVMATNFKMFYFKKKGDKHASFYVHRAVALLFIENSDSDKKFVIHLDHKADNNHVDNLKWVNRSELIKHQLSNPKRIAAIERRPNAKLTEGAVRLIKRKLFDPNRRTRIKMIAKQFGVSQMQIYRIKSGENWGHIKDF